MTRTVIATCVAVALAVVGLSAEYRLDNIKRIDQDLYKSGGLYVETRYCYHYTYGEDAIYSDRNQKIAWEDGTNCDVRRLFR